MPEPSRATYRLACLGLVALSASSVLATHDGAFHPIVPEVAHRTYTIYKKRDSNIALADTTLTPTLLSAVTMSPGQLSETPMPSEPSRQLLTRAMPNSRCLLRKSSRGTLDWRTLPDTLAEPSYDDMAADALAAATDDPWGDIYDVNLDNEDDGAQGESDEALNRLVSQNAKPVRATVQQDPVAIARNHLIKVHNVHSDECILTHHHTSPHTGVSHVYFRQMYRGWDITNAVANVNINAQGKVISAGTSFHPNPAVAARWPGRALHQPQHNRMHRRADVENLDAHRRPTKPLASTMNNRMSSAGTPKATLASDAVPIAGSANDHQVNLPKYNSPGTIDPVMAFESLVAYIGINVGHVRPVLLSQPSKHATDDTIDSLETGAKLLATSSSGSSVPSWMDTGMGMLANVTVSKNGTVPYRPRWTQQSNGDLEAVWDFELEMKNSHLHASVSRLSGQVVSLNDWVSHAQYEVFPYGTEGDPRSAKRAIVTDPADERASPLGWHDKGTQVVSTDTTGNNAIVQLNGNTDIDILVSPRPSATELLEFKYSLDLTLEPRNYTNASALNLFYWCNIMHDILYQYGFDEESGNFQENNFGRGGKGGDAVVASAQDRSGLNNAWFSTPPDGSRGRMAMFIWTKSKPGRDGSLDASIMMHEYTHGLTNRLTGGASDSDCLSTIESRGLGEGWSDFVANVLRMSASDRSNKNVTIASYANGDKGLRRYPYTTDMNVNPLTYATLKGTDVEPHTIGTLWATILNEMYWVLVDALGFNGDWYHPNLKHGNKLALQLMVDALKLQPCQPTFITARDAILLAEEQLTDGHFQCHLWRAFAKRGLGPDAARLEFSLLNGSNTPPAPATPKPQTTETATGTAAYTATVATSVPDTVTHESQSTGKVFTTQPRVKSVQGTSQGILEPLVDSATFIDRLAINAHPKGSSYTVYELSKRDTRGDFALPSQCQ
ncbi:hypothetical protein H4R34_005047 [Dimargaris verticillata]|uniref:Extracellular metalloproteinase n=1 Tax=Dimargaris verticillata TaxID=2761393 RepID=A0A9W8AXN0_9FUNG|nr:hypothetical protein H4R34_005047 [Dimargaris verticillata]